MITLKNILVATDFSEPSDDALAYGRALARAFNSTLHVLHVVGVVPLTVYGAEGYITSVPDLQKDIENSDRKQLESLLVDNDQPPLPTKSALVTSSEPAAAIIEYASKEDIDLIVAGTHGRGGVVHMLMGSVAERLVRLAPCPVLAIRHPQHGFVHPDALVATAKA